MLPEAFAAASSAATSVLQNSKHAPAQRHRLLPSSPENVLRSLGLLFGTRLLDRKLEASPAGCQCRQELGAGASGRERRQQLVGRPAAVCSRSSQWALRFPAAAESVSE